MARAYGSNATLLLKTESQYGKIAQGDYWRMPFNRCSLGSEQGLIDDPVLGQGRDPLAPMLDVINVEGDITVPLDPRYLGMWLEGLLGEASSEEYGEGLYRHCFISGKETLPSYSVELGLSNVPAYFVNMGVVLGSVALDFQRSGAASATITCIAQAEQRFNQSQAGDPQDLPFTRISQFQGSVLKQGKPIANLTSGSLSYSNNLEKIETIRDDGMIDGVDPTIASLTGKIDVRFADTELVDLASNGTAVDLTFGYQLKNGMGVSFICHEVYLPKPKLSVDGPGGVQASFDFQGARNEAKGHMLEVVLVNDLSNINGGVQ